MNPKVIRQLELWLGQALCALLTLHRRLVDTLRSPPRHTPTRIAFIKLIEQGSTVLAHAAVQRAVELVGRANVYWCVFEENREIVEILDLVPAPNVVAIRTGFNLYIDIAIALGLVGFLATVAFARFVLARGLSPESAREATRVSTPRSSAVRRKHKGGRR